MADEQPLLEAVLEMTAVSVSRAELDPRSLMLVRLAALAAVDAPPASYFLNLEAAVESGVTLEDARSVLLAIGPIIGTPRIVSSAAAIADALGIAIALDEAIQAGEA